MQNICLFVSFTANGAAPKKAHCGCVVNTDDATGISVLYSGFTRDIGNILKTVQECFTLDCPFDILMIAMLMGKDSCMSFSRVVDYDYAKCQKVQLTDHFETESPESVLHYIEYYVLVSQDRQQEAEALKAKGF